MVYLHWGHPWGQCRQLFQSHGLEKGRMILCLSCVTCPLSKRTSRIKLVHQNTRASSYQVRLRFPFRMLHSCEGQSYYTALFKTMLGCKRSLCGDSTSIHSSQPVQGAARVYVCFTGAKSSFNTRINPTKMLDARGGTPQKPCLTEARNDPRSAVQGLVLRCRWEMAEYWAPVDPLDSLEHRPYNLIEPLGGGFSLLFPTIQPPNVSSVRPSVPRSLGARSEERRRSGAAPRGVGCGLVRDDPGVKQTERGDWMGCRWV